MILLISCTDFNNVCETKYRDLQVLVLSNEAIANGLKEALDQGIEKQVSKLTKDDGFYKKMFESKFLMP